MSGELPTTMPDGRGAAYLRIGSHRARHNVQRIMGADLVEMVNMFDKPIYLVPRQRVAELDALPRYCRGSVRILIAGPQRRTGWGKPWATSS